MREESYKPFDPDIFWTNVRRCTETAGISINELAKKVKDKYGISPKTINNNHTNNYLSNIGHAIAIAGILRVPLETLIRAENKNAKDMEGYDDLRQQLETTAKAFQKAYGIDITYDIHRSNIKSFKLICTVTSKLENVYPERYKFQTGDTTDVYDVVGGNIYPSNLAQSDRGEEFYNRPSIYEHIDNFCMEDNGTGKFNNIKKLFSSYHKMRYSLGAIGKLSPFAFYLLNYEIGRLVKHYKGI